MPTQDAILQKLRQLAMRSLRLELSEDELAVMSRLDEYAGVDSLAVLIFVNAVEKEFGVKLDPDALSRETIANLPSLARFLESKC
jgi:acyl carrier protein